MAHSDGISKPSIQFAVHTSTGPAEPGEHISQCMHTAAHAPGRPPLLVSSPVSVEVLVLVLVPVALALAEFDVGGGAVGSALVGVALVVGVVSVASVPSVAPADEPVSSVSADFGAQARSMTADTRARCDRMSPA